MTVFIDGEKIGSVNLIARNNVDRSIWLLILDIILSFITHPIVVTVGIIVILLIVIYVILQAKRLARKRQVVKYRKR